MATVSKVHQDQLERIKRNIVDSYVYFRNNRDYFNEKRNFVFNTTITDAQRSALQELERPMIEFNVLEAFISRLVGEFSKQVPGVAVHADPTVSVPPVKTIDVVQGHMRKIITDLRATEIYKDQLGGGYSAMKIWTEYEHAKSFKQKICIDRVYDPLLCGWDPSSQKSHKGDGTYCFEIIPLTEGQLKEHFGDNIDLEGCFNGSLGGFKWGYKSNRKKIIMLCQYYEKRNKRVLLYELPGGQCLTKEEYEEMLLLYQVNDDLAVPPDPVNKRWTLIPRVDRYQIIATQVLEYVKTDFCGLPIIFVDGNSVTVRKNGDGSMIEQICRSYIHNAIGSQMLKNLSGQTLANHIENLVEHKMKIAMESIPPGREEDYTNTQLAGNFLYKQYSDDGTQQYNPPQEVVKVPLPPEILNTYMTAEQTIQAELGSYDASLGINKNQLSGVAIVEGATQSNAAAMPFVVNYLASLQQSAEIILDLIPKYYVTPRTIPVLTNEDKKEHVQVNTPGHPTMKFNPNDLKVIVSSGVNFEVQKNRALQMLIELSNALPGMANLINTPKGLSIVMDNLSIKGADQLKILAEQADDSMKNAPPPPPNPMQQKVAIDKAKVISKDQNDKSLIGIKQQIANTKQLEALAKISDARIQSALQAERDDTERMVHGINLHIANKEADGKIVNNMVKSAADLINSNPIIPTNTNQAAIVGSSPQSDLIPNQ